MGTRDLAEAVILQSIEDLWSKDAREESINFFKKSGFVKYAAIASMTTEDRLKLLNIIGEAIRSEKKSATRRINNVEFRVRAV